MGDDATEASDAARSCLAAKLRLAASRFLKSGKNSSCGDRTAIEAEQGDASWRRSLCEETKRRFPADAQKRNRKEVFGMSLAAIRKTIEGELYR